MAKPKFSTWIVAMIVVSGTVAVLGLMMSELSTNYDVTYSDNESPEIISKMDELYNYTDDWKEDILVSEANESNQGFLTSTVDILGDLFKTGLTSLKTIGKSFDVFSTMFYSGFNQLELGGSGNIVRNVILASVIVIITIGIIITVLVQRQV